MNKFLLLYGDRSNYQYEFLAKLVHDINNHSWHNENYGMFANGLNTCSIVYNMTFY